MKLTKSKLKQIIKEELNKERILKEDNMLMEADIPQLVSYMTSENGIRKKYYAEALKQIATGIEETANLKGPEYGAAYEKIINDIHSQIRGLGG